MSKRSFSTAPRWRNFGEVFSNIHEALKNIAAFTDQTSALRDIGDENNHDNNVIMRVS